ncbi:MULTISPECIES: GNAT family N-acetyltransferase [Streptomyces]|uniref:GNAT family N-acetyltransferase n=1 Tax=Streptomyces TaxID=1883 RepID=UPI003316FD88
MAPRGLRGPTASVLLRFLWLQGDDRRSDTAPLSPVPAGCAAFRLSPMKPRQDGPAMRLQPLTETGLRQIHHWFDHPEVQSRLGGRSWIRTQLQLTREDPGSVFRGAVVLRCHAWIGLDQEGTPVAFLCGDVYDRWVRYHGEGPDGPLLTEADPRRAMGLAYLVDPDRWRHGHGRAALDAVVAHPATRDVETFFFGIDADNHASRNCAESAGFTLTDPEPDHEEMLYYSRAAPTARAPRAGRLTGEEACPGSGGGRTSCSPRRNHGSVQGPGPGTGTG